MDIRSPIYALNRGLDLIVDGEPLAGLLPQQQRIAPSELGHVPELQRLLAQANYDELLDGLIRPAVSDHQLLSPTSFKAELDGAEAQLRAAANEQPDAARVLNRCARLLADQRALCELMTQYRNALVAG